MNGINTITVKNETSVAKYAAQYTNGEHVTLIPKDGIKYYTDGKGGYYMLENNIVNNPDDDAINKPAEEQVDLMTKLKKIAENYDALAKITVINGKLCFDGKEVTVGEAVIPETPGKEPEDKIFWQTDFEYTILSKGITMKFYNLDKYREYEKTFKTN